MPGGIASALWRAAPWLILAAAAWIGIAGVLPPAAVGAVAPAEDFSAERAFAHIEAIARQDRPIGSPGNAAARDYLVTELEAMGVPGAGYVFAWPALAATLATGVGERWGWAASGWWQRLGAPALVAVPTVVLSLPPLDTLHQFGQPRPGNLDSELLDVVALVGLIAALAAGLLSSYLRRAAIAGPSR